MKRVVYLIAACLLGGCMVSNETYQTEFLRAREFEAKSQTLSSQLEEKKSENGELSAKLKLLEKDLAAEKDKSAKGAVAVEECKSRLAGCQVEKDRLDTDLDLSKKSFRTCEAEKDNLRSSNSAAIKELEKNSADKSQELKAEIDRLDRTNENLREKILVLESEKSILTEQREKLKLEKEEKITEITKNYDGLLGSMSKEIEAGRVAITQLKGQLQVKLLDEILFDSGSAVVKEEGKAVLAKVAEAIKGETDRMVVIEGHTDNVKITGNLVTKYPSNWELSTARAVSVLRFLVEDQKMEPTRIAATGYGEFKPISENETPEGKAKNRRIEIKLVPLE